MSAVDEATTSSYSLAIVRSQESVNGKISRDSVHIYDTLDGRRQLTTVMR